MKGKLGFLLFLLLATPAWAGTVDSGGTTAGSGGGGGAGVCGNDGNIQYNNAGSCGGSDTFYIDDTNGRLGVGTTSPVDDFEIEVIAGQNPSFVMSDGDVSHTMTVPALAANVLLRVQEVNGGNGGAYFNGYTDGDRQALQFRGAIGTASPGATTPAMRFIGAKTDGATNVTSLAATGLIAGFANNSTTVDVLTINANGDIAAQAFSGTQRITSSHTLDLGWNPVDITDNLAGGCNAGCTSACVFGVENATGTAVTNLVACTAATADTCMCAGPN